MFNKKNPQKLNLKHLKVFNY